MHRPCDSSSCTTRPICLLYNLGTCRKSDRNSNEMLAPNSYPQHSVPSISVGGHTRDALHGPSNLNAVTLCSRDCGPVPRGMSLSGVGFLLSGVGSGLAHKAAQMWSSSASGHQLCLFLFAETPRHVHTQQNFRHVLRALRMEAG